METFWGGVVVGGFGVMCFVYGALIIVGINARIKRGGK
jgi:hypothetical protein